MTNSIRIPWQIVSLAGAIVAVLGCFLPWQQPGEMPPFSVLRIPTHQLPEFNSRLLVLLLGIVSFWLTTRPPAIITAPRRWLAYLSASLLILSTYHLLGWLTLGIVHIDPPIETPSLGVGLMLVFVASLIMVAANLIRRQLTIRWSGPGTQQRTLDYVLGG